MIESVLELIMVWICNVSLLNTSVDGFCRLAPLEAVAPLKDHRPRPLAAALLRRLRRLPVEVCLGGSLRGLSTKPKCSGVRSEEISQCDPIALI